MCTIFFKESPFKTLISFHKRNFRRITKRRSVSSQLRKGLVRNWTFPEFKTELKILKYWKKRIITKYTCWIIPTVLTDNEIKAVTIPFQNFAFNYSSAFKNNRKRRNDPYDMTIRDFDENQFYVMSCILILNSFYKQKFQI
jgi:hypothetical protein